MLKAIQKLNRVILQSNFTSNFPAHELLHTINVAAEDNININLDLEYIVNTEYASSIQEFVKYVRDNIAKNEVSSITWVDPMGKYEIRLGREIFTNIQYVGYQSKIDSSSRDPVKVLIKFTGNA